MKRLSLFGLAAVAMLVTSCVKDIDTDIVKENGIVAAVAKYSDINDPADAAMIEVFYKMLERRAPFAEFLPVLATILHTEH